jgi:hypothetical protein
MMRRNIATVNRSIRLTSCRVRLVPLRRCTSTTTLVPLPESQPAAFLRLAAILASTVATV